MSFVCAYLRYFDQDVGWKAKMYSMDTQRQRRVFWVLGHMILAMSFTAMGSSSKSLIYVALDPTKTQGELRTLMCGSVACSFGASIIIQLTIPGAGSKVRQWRKRWRVGVRVVSSLVAMSFGWIGPELVSFAVLIFFLSALVMLQVCLDMYGRRHRSDHRRRSDRRRDGFSKRDSRGNSGGGGGGGGNGGGGDGDKSRTTRLLGGSSGEHDGGGGLFIGASGAEDDDGGGGGGGGRGHDSGSGSSGGGYSDATGGEEEEEEEEENDDEESDEDEGVVAARKRTAWNIDDMAHWNGEVSPPPAKGKQGERRRRRYNRKQRAETWQDDSHGRGGVPTMSSSLGPGYGAVGFSADMQRSQTPSGLRSIHRRGGSGSGSGNGSGSGGGSGSSRVSLSPRQQEQPRRRPSPQLRGSRRRRNSDPSILRTPDGPDQNEWYNACDAGFEVGVGGGGGSGGGSGGDSGGGGISGDSVRVNDSEDTGGNYQPPAQVVGGGQGRPRPP